MPRKPTGGKAGRPRIPLITPDLDEDGLSDKLPPKKIDFEAVLYWIDLGATAADIAGFFRVGVNTLDRRLREYLGMGFGELKEKVCGTVKIQLRKNQFEMSRKNATMAIWLGKQWLGQKENVSELKDLVVHELRAGIRQISQESGSETTFRPALANQSSISDCGQRRELDQVQDESCTETGL